MQWWRPSRHKSIASTNWFGHFLVNQRFTGVEPRKYTSVCSRPLGSLVILRLDWLTHWRPRQFMGIFHIRSPLFDEYPAGGWRRWTSGELLRDLMPLTNSLNDVAWYKMNASSSTWKAATQPNICLRTKLGQTLVMYSFDNGFVERSQSFNNEQKRIATCRCEIKW